MARRGERVSLVAPLTGTMWPARPEQPSSHDTPRDGHEPGLGWDTWPGSSRTWVNRREWIRRSDRRTLLLRHAQRSARNCPPTVVLTCAPDLDSGAFPVIEMDNSSQQRTPMADSPRVGGARPCESRKPCGKNSFGNAHAQEQRVHVGPEPLPPFTFLVRRIQRVPSLLHRTGLACRLPYPGGPRGACGCCFPPR